LRLRGQELVSAHIQRSEGRNEPQSRWQVFELVVLETKAAQRTQALVECGGETAQAIVAQLKLTQAMKICQIARDMNDAIEAGIQHAKVRQLADGWRKST
jgi:hypothetical protein